MPLAVGLSDIVEQHGEYQYLRVRQLRENSREERELGFVFAPEPLYFPYREQRMRVHRVYVVEVVLDLAAYLLELGYVFVEEPEPVHLFQGIEYVPALEYLEEGIGYVPDLPEPAVGFLDEAQDQVLCGLADLHVEGLRVFKRLDYGGRVVFEGVPVAHGQEVVHDGVVLIDPHPFFRPEKRLLLISVQAP